jgi:hypothetical protein
MPVIGFVEFIGLVVLRLMGYGWHGTHVALSFSLLLSVAPKF